MDNKSMLLTVKEVMGLLRIQRTKVYLLIESGFLSGVKVGSDWRIRTDSVEQAIGPIPKDFFADFDHPSRSVSR